MESLLGSGKKANYFVIWCDIGWRVCQLEKRITDKFTDIVLQNGYKRLNSSITINGNRLNSAINGIF